MCIFCHFDKDNKIADYVVNYIENLRAADCDIIFVSNCSEIEDKYINKIKNNVHRIILRANVGYDFAAYMTGFFEEAEKEKYNQIIFANDSVYGPFYPLEKVFDKMKTSNFDMWGITDNICNTYHIQSYFLVFNKNMIGFLEGFFDKFEFSGDKEEIVIKNEQGLSKKALEAGFKLGALCKHQDVISFEHYTLDEKIRKIKSDIENNLFYKPSWKKFFSKKYNRKLNFKKYFDVNLVPHLSSWYSLIEYFNSPFIKISLLKDPKLIHYHNFIYRDVIRKKYPEFDLEIMENHLRKIRKLEV